MKQRTITAVVGLFLFFTILFFFETYLYNIAIAAVSILAVHELLLANKYTSNLFLTIVSCTFAGIVPLIVTKANNTNSVIAIIILVAIFFGVLLKNHEKIKLEQIGLTFFISIIFPFAFATLVYIRDQFGLYTGLYYTLIIFSCAWGSDTGAYFTGRFFGKRKLAPKISPNKTIEGVYGGVLSCLIFVSLITYLYWLVMGSYFGVSVNINYAVLLIISVMGSLVGVMGDLTASMIKRQCGIKDFGSIMPGHGGIVDRFDSTLFIAPFFFVVLQILKGVS